MVNTAQIAISVDSSQVKEATAALDEFTRAADRARDAMERLGRGFIIVSAGPGGEIAMSDGRRQS